MLASALKADSVKGELVGGRIVDWLGTVREPSGGRNCEIPFVLFESDEVSITCFFLFSKYRVLKRSFVTLYGVPLLVSLVLRLLFDLNERPKHMSRSFDTLCDCLFCNFRLLNLLL